MIRAFKLVVAALVVALPLSVMIRSLLTGSAEVDGLWIVFALFVCLPSLIYLVGVKTKVGIVVVGALLLAETVRTWLVYASFDETSFRGLIPIIRVIPETGFTILCAVGDLAYRFFTSDPLGDERG